MSPNRTHSCARIDAARAAVSTARLPFTVSLPLSASTRKAALTMLTSIAVVSAAGDVTQ